MRSSVVLFRFSQLTFSSFPCSARPLDQQTLPPALHDRDDRLADIDRQMQSSLAPVSSNIIKACLPGGQSKPFPHNCFSLMVLTGAKGSLVNHSQVRERKRVLLYLITTVNLVGNLKVFFVVRVDRSDGNTDSVKINPEIQP